MKVLVVILHPDSGEPSVWGVFSSDAIEFARRSAGAGWRPDALNPDGSAVFVRRTADPYVSERLIASHHEVLTGEPNIFTTMHPEAPND